MAEKFIIKQSIKYKRLVLKLDKNYNLIITAPQQAPLLLIEKFILNRSNKIIEYRNKKYWNDPFNIQKGSVDLFGKNYLVRKIVSTTSRMKIEILNLDPKPIIHFHIPKVAWNDLKKQELFFISYLKKEGKFFLTNRVNFYCKKFNLKVSKIEIKNLEKKWGWCSSKQVIALNVKLLCWEIDVIDYVICHELAHLTYMDHSAKFWALVGSYYPNYKNAAKKLKFEIQ